MEYLEVAFIWIGKHQESIQAVSIVVASVVAVYGINTWRRELKGKKEYELAEEVLSLFYRARDIIIAMRSPHGFEGEGNTRKPQENETPEEKKIKDRAFVVFERFQKEKETFDRLHALRYRYMVLFDKDKEQPFRELNGIVQDIFMAASMLGEDWRRDEYGRSSKIMEERQARIQKYEAIFWQQAKSDGISMRVDNIIEQVEAECRVVIEGRRSSVFTVRGRQRSRQQRIIFLA